jgi:hypothetical protein
MIPASSYWQTRAYIGKRLVRRSTKTAVRSKAIVFAKDFYHELLLKRARSRRVVNNLDLEASIGKELATYCHRRGKESWVKSLQKTYNFIGLPKLVGLPKLADAFLPRVSFVSQTDRDNPECRLYSIGITSLLREPAELERVTSFMRQTVTKLREAIRGG